MISFHWCVARHRPTTNRNTVAPHITARHSTAQFSSAQHSTAQIRDDDRHAPPWPILYHISKFPTSDAMESPGCGDAGSFTARTRSAGASGQWSGICPVSDKMLVENEPNLISLSRRDKMLVAQGKAQPPPWVTRPHPISPCPVGTICWRTSLSI